MKAAPNLDTLLLTRCPQLNDDSLAVVGELVQLAQLSLNSDEMTDDGLAHLAALTNLQSPSCAAKGSRAKG